MVFHVFKYIIYMSKHSCSWGNTRLYANDTDGHCLGMCMGVHLQIVIQIKGSDSVARLRVWPFYARNIWWQGSRHHLSTSKGALDVGSLFDDVFLFVKPQRGGRQITFWFCSCSIRLLRTQFFVYLLNGLSVTITFDNNEGSCLQCMVRKVWEGFLTTRHPIVWNP